MKKITFLTLLTLFLVLASCGQQNTTPDSSTTNSNTSAVDSASGCSLDYNPICGEDGLTYQNTCFSSLRSIGVEHLGACSYEVCSFNDQDHYVLANMFYHVDDRSRPYIEIIYGTFRLQEDKDGWTFIRAINTGVSYYYNRMLEYDAKITESGNTVTCSNTTEAPDTLKEFLKTHGKILTMMVEGSEENVTQSNLSDTSVSANATE